jgi:imidazolonepropionase
LRVVAAAFTPPCEIKSGYGLSVHDELRTSRVIGRLAAAGPLNIVPTCLGAHEVPLEYREQRDGRAA